MNIVITGKLSNTRDKLTEEFAQYGIYVLSSIRPSVDFLITDTPDSGTSKNAMAQKFGIERISEENFRKQFLSGDSNQFVIGAQALFAKKNFSNPIKTMLRTNKIKEKPTETSLTRYLDF